MNVFQTEWTTQMKKFTSGANGHMFSLFRHREKKQRTKFEKGKAAFLFLHIAVLTACAFWLHGPAIVGLSAKAQGGANVEEEEL